MAKAQLVLESVDVTPKPRDFGYDGTAAPADVLLDADGQPVDVEAVKTQPGFHAFVEKNGGQARTAVYCDDPAQHGYTRRKEVSAAHRGLSPEEIAAQELAEQQAQERLDRLKLAATVRREFIVEKFGTAKGARALFVPALRTATLGKAMSRSADLDELYRALGGSDHDTLTGAGEDRLRRSLIAKYICALEYNLAGTAQPHRMWIDQKAAVAWYDELRQRTYPLTDDEQQLYQSWTATDADDGQDDETSAPPVTGAPQAPVDEEITDALNGSDADADTDGDVAQVLFAREQQLADDSTAPDINTAAEVTDAA